MKRVMALALSLTLSAFAAQAQQSAATATAKTTKKKSVAKTDPAVAAQLNELKQAIEAAREFGFEVAGVMCLVERQEAGGRPSVEKAAAPAQFVSIFTANDVRKEHVAQNDETSPSIVAFGAGCEICGRQAVVHSPRIRCEQHKV